MKGLIFLGLVFFAVSGLAGATADFPLAPDPQLTPGHLCAKPDYYRYPENIPYCIRNVSTQMKDATVERYRSIGFRIPGNRSRGLKIDHFYPLCLGGSNEPSNLWPQHMSVYQVTDRLEQELCIRLAHGMITQRQGIAWIREGKFNLDRVPYILDQLEKIGRP